MKAIAKVCAYSLLFVTITHAPGIAGGSSWKVRIEKMQVKSPSHATVVLKALEDEVFYEQQCTRFLVEIDFQPDYLRGRNKLDLERENAALKIHQEALASLQAQYTKQAPVRFGELMGGLIQKPANDSWLDSLIQSFLRLFGKEEPPLLDSSIPTECQFTAPGLTIFDDSASKRVVYVRNEL
ncbi:MAG: hypothetical protein RBJ76_08455 [Stenomitos frigidus ULC029]